MRRLLALALLLLSAPPLILPVSAGAARRGVPRPFRRAALRPAPSSDALAQDLLRRMLQAENSLALSGDQITTVARGGLDLSSEQQVQRDGARALRIVYVRPARLAGEQIMDNGRFYCHLIPARDTLELSPSRIGTLRVRVPEIIRQVRQGRLVVQSVGQDTVAGHACFIVQVTARGGSAVSSRRFWIDPTNGAQLRIEHYDAGGQLQSASYYAQVTYSPVFDRKTFRLPPAGGSVVTTGFPVATLTLEQVRAQAGFAVPMPAYLPPGFHFSGGAFSESRKGRIAEMRFVGGATALSLFETPDDHPGGAARVERPRRGVVSGRQAGMKVVLIGNLADAELGKVLGSLK